MLTLQSGPALSSCLDRATRHFLEQGFRTDLGDIRLIISPGATCPRPYALGNQIHLDERWYQPHTSQGRLVLAHEVAHLLQKRRGIAGGSQASVAALEAEAHTAAATLLAGGHYTCRLADAVEEARFWGPSGHYYTTYFLLAAAGVPFGDAYHMAFWGQVPDQVNILDATWLGINYKTENLFSDPEPSDVNFTEDEYEELFPLLVRDLVKKYPTNYEIIIQKGLHCLNGNHAAHEQTYRAHVLRSVPFNTPQFGIAMHAFGDSFAHERKNKDKTMYGAPWGHASQGHAPDNIHTWPAQFMKYARELYKIICERTPVAKEAKPISPKTQTVKTSTAVEQRRLEPDQVAKALEKIVALDDEEAQIETFRNLFQQYGWPMSSYDPVEETETILLPDAFGTLNWTEFRDIHAPKDNSLKLGDRFLLDTITWAISWTYRTKGKTSGSGDYNTMAF
jgi:hypothetical protein